MLKARVAASPRCAVGFSLRRYSPILTMMPELSSVDRTASYGELREQSRALFADEGDALANAANRAALLFCGLPDLNWAGFYFLRGAELVLGAFQGNVACARIAMGKRVCGTAAQRRETLMVPDVRAFPGHMACDAGSQSEIVIPLLQGERLLGVLDWEAGMQEYLRASELSTLP